jgi:hypothetical protein
VANVVFPGWWWTCMLDAAAGAGTCALWS